MYSIRKIFIVLSVNTMVAVTIVIFQWQMKFKKSLHVAYRIVIIACCLCRQIDLSKKILQAIRVKAVGTSLNQCLCLSS